MTLLIGTETVEATTLTVEAGKIEAYQFICVSSGILEMVAVHSAVALNGATSMILGIYANESGEKPGAVLAQKTYSGTPATEAWIEATGFNLSVTNETVYWLAFLPIGGIFHYWHKESGTNTLRRASTTGNTELISTTWEALQSFGPGSLKALGTISNSIVNMPLFNSPTTRTPSSLNKPFKQGSIKKQRLIVV